jgi:tetratricopeptide (TPR) repeat protein
MRESRRDVFVRVALFVSVLAVFSQTCWHGFSNWDDPRYVSSNSRVITGLTGANIAWALATFHAANWHPLTWVSLQIDAQLFGPQPWGFHLTNIFIHAANVVLLYWALQMATGKVVRSALVAAFFGLHPLHVESVAWIAERKDVLSTFFWLVSCIAYGWYVARPGPMRYVLMLATFATGLMAKPMLVTLPLAFLLLDYWPLSRIGLCGSRESPESEQKESCPAGQCRRISWLLLEKVPLLLVAAASCMVTLYAQQAGGALRTLEEYSLAVRVGNAVTSYCTYIGQMFWPKNLGVFYPHSTDLAIWPAFAAFLALAAVTVLVCAKGRSARYLPVGWFWYLGTLVPIIGLVQVGEAARADRYTYIPLVGLFMAVVWACADLARRWRVQRSFVALAVLLVSICVVMCYRQLQYWRDDITLWEHTLQACGESPGAYVQLGGAFQKLENFETAARCYEKALCLDPNDQFALLDLGTVLLGQGKVEQAIEQYREAVRRVPQSARHHYYYGAALARVGRTQEAIAELEEALRFDQNWTAAHKSLGTLLSAQDRFDEAIPHLRAAVAGGLGDPLAHYNLGRMLAMQGNFAESAECLKQAISLQQRNWRLHAMLAFALHESGQESAANEQYRQASRLNAKWVEALNQEAWLLATNPDARKRTGRTARQFAQQVCQATAGRQARFLDTLAAAEAEAGNFSLAIETAKHAIAILSSDQQASLAREIAGRLQLYEKNQPIRTDSGSGTR